MGHERVLITFFSYGEVQESRQADIFKGFGDPEEQGVLPSSAKEFARAVAKELSISSTV